MKAHLVRHGLLLAPILVVLAACQAKDHPASGRGGGAGAVSIKTLMDTRIDPSADGLWASVGTTESAAGTQSLRPNSEAEWARLRGLAANLIDGATRLGAARVVGPNGESGLADASTPGIRTAAQIKADIDADPARFAAAAGRLRSAGLQAADAIEARDPEALVAAGAAMDAACEACHSAYWYPRTPPLALPGPRQFGALARSGAE